MNALRNGPTRVLAVVLCACGPVEAPTPTPVLRMAIDAWPGYFPSVIAQQRGWMAEEGVQLEITPVRDTTRLIADFAGGRYDLITVSLGNAVTASRARPDVMVLLIANESAGAEVVFSSAETPGLILDTVLVTRETLERHPEAVRGFARAWFRASDAWLADPATGNALASEGLGMVSGPVSLEGAFIYQLADNHQAMRGGQDAPLTSLIRRYADFFVERGSLSRPPDAETMFAPAYLPPSPSVTP